MPTIIVSRITYERFNRYVLPGRVMEKTATPKPGGRMEIEVDQDIIDRLIKLRVTGESFDETLMRAMNAMDEEDKK